MKKHFLATTALSLGLAAMMAVSPITAMAANEQPKATATPTAAEAPKAVSVAKTKAWDTIKETLGGVPKSVRKIEYSGSTFYLGKDVTDDDFKAVLAVGPELISPKPAKDDGKLYQYPVYILWNNDKTVLLVHPIRFDYDDVLEAVSVKADPPKGLTDSKDEKPVKDEKAVKETPKPAKDVTKMTKAEKQEYMLSAEYADEVRKEFYRLLNEHRVANGLRELEVDLELQAYADIRADEQRILFGHTRPDGSKAGSGWHNSHNIINSRYAENAVATGAIGANPKNTALGIFTLWKESKGHNRHMLYDFDPGIKMALGIAPKLDKDGFVTTGAIFATGY